MTTIFLKSSHELLFLARGIHDSFSERYKYLVVLSYYIICAWFVSEVNVTGDDRLIDRWVVLSRGLSIIGCNAVHSPPLPTALPPSHATLPAN